MDTVMNKDMMCDVSKKYTYTEFTKVTFILRSGKEIAVNYPTEELNKMMEALMNLIESDTNNGDIYIPEFGINPKNTLISVSAIDTVLF